MRALWVWIVLLTLIAPAGAHDLRFARPVVAGVRANVVIVDMTNPRLMVRPVVAGRPSCFAKNRLRTFSSMVKVTHCLAAINGTFFDPKTFRTLGTMVYRGRLFYEGYVGNALVLDRGRRWHFMKLYNRDSQSVDWSPYLFGIAAGPTLVCKGRISLNPRDEGFHDPRVYRNASRSAIGYRRNGELLLVTVHRKVSLRRLARMMQTLGAVYALNLDGGSSSGLYYKGKWITKPRRKLTNILAVTLERDAPLSKL